MRRKNKLVFLLRILLLSALACTIPQTYTNEESTETAPFSEPDQAGKAPEGEPTDQAENGYIESFNGKMRDELLDGEIFYSLKEVQVLIEMWREEYNTVRLHSSLVYQPPIPATIVVHPSHIQQAGLTE